MRGFEKNFIYPSYVPMHFFEAAPGQGVRVQSKIFFLQVWRFLHQNETTAG
jgi:hypothetical protein